MTRPILVVSRVDKRAASELVVKHHYLHRKPPISYAHGLYVGDNLVGVVTYGSPASHHLRKGVAPKDPTMVYELNRLWVSDEMPRNTETWFLSRSLRDLPPLIVVSYADTAYGHSGVVYRAAGFHYAGWTDMERRMPRFDYLPNGGGHTRNAFRAGAGYVRVRRRPKAKYWITTGNRADRRRLTALVQWPSLSWREFPVPMEVIDA